MKFTSALTTKTGNEAAVADLTGKLGQHKHDLVFVFVHPAYGGDLPDLLEGLQLGLRAACVMGCSGAGIIGEDAEVEGQPAVAVLAGELPATQLRTFHISQAELEAGTPPAFWQKKLALAPDEMRGCVLLADPFSIATPTLVERVGTAFPEVSIVGGLASGGREAGDSLIFLDRHRCPGGAVGLGLAGAVELRTVVSQGCRPIGEPLTVTRAERNVIFELGGRSPLAALNDLLSQLSAGDKQLAQRALVLGRVVNEYKDEYGTGDFLIRNLLQLDPQSGALAVGDVMRAGQTVQFQVRDGRSADADLHEHLLQQKQSPGEFTPRGALLFSCLGRGAGMFGVAHHDVRALHEQWPGLPAAGFFCNGEIGPVGRQTFVYGFTSVIGLIGKPGCVAGNQVTD